MNTFYQKNPQFNENESSLPQPTKSTEASQAHTSQQKGNAISERISPTSRDLPVSNLGLSIRPSGALANIGITTIGAFVDAIQSGLGKIKNFGVGARGETLVAYRALSDAVDATGEIDWLLYAENRGFRVLPAEIDLSFSDFLERLPKLFQTIIEEQFDNAYWRVFQNYWLDPIEKKKTFEELGVDFGVSRARVQQMDFSTIEALRGALLEKNYSGLHFRIRPELTRFFRNARKYFDELGQTSWTKSAWLAEFARIHQIDVQEIRDTGDLMIRLLGFQTRSLNIPNLDNLVFDTSCPPAEIEKTLAAVAALHNVLREEYLGLTAVDLAGKLSEKTNACIRIDDLATYATLCPTVERIAGEIYRIKFPFLKNRMDGTVRVLAEKGTPMSREDIFQEINLQADKPFTEMKNLVNQMVQDKRICAIGKSGMWALAEWGVETRPIFNLIEEILTENGSPMEIQVIAEKVQEIRPASILSVGIYLNLRRDRFFKVATGFYGLTSWGKDGTQIQERKSYQRKTPLQSDLVVERAIQLLSANHDQMPLADLVKTLESELTINRNSIYGYISQAPEIRTSHNIDKVGKLCHLTK